MTDDKNCSNGCGKQGTIGNTIGFDAVEWWCEECACMICLFARSDEWEMADEGDKDAVKCKCGYYYTKINTKQCDKCGKECEKDDWFICGGCSELFCHDCDTNHNPHASGKCKVCEDDEEDEEIDCRYCGAEASVPCDETKCPFRICNRIDREHNKQ